MAFTWAQQFEVLPRLLLQSWRGQEFPFLPCAPLFCGTKQPNQILLFFSNSWRWSKHSFPLIIKYIFSFKYGGFQELKFKLEHWNSQIKSPVGHLQCWHWGTQLGALQCLDSTGSLCSRIPLYKLSCHCQLQQPTLPTANVSHIGRSLNVMPKCNTGPDTIKEKKEKSCWCKHYAFTSPSLTGLLHSQQQVAISLVISSTSSNAHLPVFNTLYSPSYHPVINPFPSTIS